MTDRLESLIAQAKERAHNGDDEGAMSLANKLVTEHPQDIKVWSLRGYLHRRNNEYAQSVADLTRAMEINAKGLGEAPMDVAGMIAIDLLFNRGADKFAIGDDQSAIDDFTQALMLSERYRSDDYNETLYFWRAEALLRLGKNREALSDLSRVNDEFSFWTYKLRTKRDLLADCENPLG